MSDWVRDRLGCSWEIWEAWGKGPLHHATGCPSIARPERRGLGWGGLTPALGVGLGRFFLRGLIAASSLVEPKGFSGIPAGRRPCFYYAT